MFTFLRNLGFGSRLVLSFGGAALLLAILTVFTAVQSRQVREAAAEVSREQAERMALAQDWRQDIVINAQRSLAILMSNGPTMAEQFAAEMKAVAVHGAAAQKHFADIETTRQGKALQAQLYEVRQRYQSIRAKALEAHAQSGLPLDDSMIQGYRKISDEYVAASIKLVEFEAARNESLAARMSEAMQFMQSIILTLSVGGTLAAAVFGTLMHRWTVPALRTAQECADRISRGDLSRPIEASSRDEVGRLMRSLSHMQDSLRRLVGDLHASADSIGTASTEVAMGNQDLSARTEQAAANLQQTASAVEQISGTLGQSAGSAAQSNELASRAAIEARTGSAAVCAVVGTMDGIRSSSAEISDITSLIDAIAFQTNILALNATLEAARAGVHGRGFAVVATEVRRLAQRSAAAAKDIKARISASVEQIQTGTTEAREAGRVLTEVVSSIEKVSAMVGDISAATTEQASGLGEINRAVAQLDQFTQQNAALVEESASAAGRLKEQAEALIRSVQRFRLSA